ncbi:hypothetical protein [Acidimangrovimonas pyrenivorans]|uniref:Uncharacterized protein n=1 Tax=Acidimangrovimonas pyrenivorans TaxID=2030798 RepID=A0ABV7AKX2_9RHOB
MARAPGCITQKELCARNPTTQFTLQNSYKWMKGRSQPRSGEVYRDWALLLDLDQSAQFLSDCSPDVFTSLVSARYGLDPAGSGAPSAPAPASDPAAMFRGDYACCSSAWPKAARGRRIRGALPISPDADGTLRASYEERVSGGTLHYSGPVRVAKRMLSMTLSDTRPDTRQGHALFLNFPPPLPPVTVLTGLLAGSAYQDFETRPTASRILCVRSLQPAGAIARDNRYIDRCSETIDRDLESLGYDLGPEREIGALCREFLTTPGTGGRLEVPLS